MPLAVGRGVIRIQRRRDFGSPPNAALGDLDREDEVNAKLHYCTAPSKLVKTRLLKNIHLSNSM